MTLFWMVLDAFGPGSTHLVVIPWNNARRLSNPGGLFFRDASWDFNLNKTLFRRNQWMYPLVNIHITMENHHVQWENRLFLWPFSIAMLNYQRVICNYIYIVPPCWSWLNHLSLRSIYQFVIVGIFPINLNRQGTPKSSILAWGFPL